MVQLTNTLDTQNLKDTAMVQLTNTLDTQNLKDTALQWYTEQEQTQTLDTQNLKEHCNGIVNKHPGYTESQGALQWYS